MEREAVQESHPTLLISGGEGWSVLSISSSVSTSSRARLLDLGMSTY